MKLLKACWQGLGPYCMCHKVGFNLDLERLCGRLSWSICSIHTVDGILLKFCVGNVLACTLSIYILAL